MTFGGSGSSVSIVTGYGLDSPGIKSWWGRDFPHLYNSCRVFPEGKERPGCDADPSPRSNAMVKKE